MSDTMEQTIAEKLKAFCDPESVRFCLSEPFVQNGFVYATDGRVAACVKTNEPDTVSTEGRFPRMANVINTSLQCSTQWDISELGCGECGGSGKTTSTKCPDCKDGRCSECYGSGTVTCHACDHEHDCEECEGTGSCETCNGDCEVEQYECGCVQCEKSYVSIGGKKLLISSARKIDSLKNVKYSIVRDGNFSKLLFESDCGIRGCAMLSSETV